MEADRADVTVAIATMNRPAALARCLDAVLAGEIMPAQIVIVDQSHNDETRDLLAARAPGNVPVDYVRQERRGLAASRNLALRRAAAAHVAMTDDDCVPDRGWLAAICRAFAAQPALTAVSGRILPLGPDAPGMFAISSRPGSAAREVAQKAPPWLTASGGNLAVCRSAWEQAGGFDERLGAGTRGQAGEDIDFAYRLLRRGLRIRYDPRAVVYHERQDLRRRMATRWSYGFGAGALAGKWLRAGDTYAVRLLLGWLLWRGRQWAGAAVRGQKQAAAEASLIVRGTLAGVMYGLRLRGEA